MKHYTIEHVQTTGSLHCVVQNRAEARKSAFEIRRTFQSFEPNLIPLSAKLTLARRRSCQMLNMLIILEQMMIYVRRRQNSGMEGASSWKKMLLLWCLIML